MSILACSRRWRRPPTRTQRATACADLQKRWRRNRRSVDVRWPTLRPGPAATTAGPLPNEPSMTVYDQLADRWQTSVVLKRDVLSTVERGRFRTEAGEVDAVLRRV